jgi:hypothetical protein
LDARKKAIKFKLVQIFELNHTVQVEPGRPVCITIQTGLAVVWLPKKRRRQSHSPTIRVPHKSLQNVVTSYKGKRGNKDSKEDAKG